jgi:type II secretory pathway predicted ATPase ExeA/tetratricopeptide (TPR) repeat protein
MEANGFVVLLGDVGTGKTTLVNALIETLDDTVLVASISHTTLDAVEFLNLIAKTYDMSVDVSNKMEFLFFLKSFMQKANAEGKELLLIIDEAHRLSEEILEEIRLISNMEHAGKKLINIFFVGQNEFKEVLLSPSCHALRQRITLFCSIEPLSENETHEYVFHRLKFAGTNERLFSPDAIREIQKFTKGYPRLINIICNRALLTGYVKEQKEIDANIVIECASEISFLDPKASKIPIAKIDGISNLEIPLADQLQAEAAELKSRPHQQEEIPENINFKAKDFEDSTRDMICLPVSVNQPKLKLIGLAVAIALIVVTVTLGIGMYAESPVWKEVKPQPDRTSTDEKSGALVKRDKLEMPQQSKKIEATASELSETDSPKEATQKIAQDSMIEKEKASAEPQPVLDTTQSFHKNTSPQSMANSGHQLTIPELPENGEVQGDPLVPQVDTLAMASSALKQKHFQTAIDLVEANQGRNNESNRETRKIYSKALSGRADQIMADSPLEAEAMLQKAVEVNPDNVEAHYKLGKIYTRSKKYVLAINAYENAVSLNPKLSEAFFNLGFIYATTGNYEYAEKLFAKVIQLKPPYLDKAYFNMAVIQEKLGKKKECLANLKMAVMIRPENQKAQSYLEQIMETAEEFR